MIDRLGDEGAGAAGRVEDVLVERFGHHLLHDGPRQPVRGVVFPQLTALIGRYDGLVENGGNVVRSLLPVEPGNAPGHGPQEGQPSDLGGPGEKVRLHDPLKAGLASEVVARSKSAGSFSASRSTSPPKEAWTTIPMTALR